MLKPGQKVICIDDRPSGFYGTNFGLKKDTVYTVEATVEAPNGWESDGDGIWLKEIQISHPFCPGFLSSRFRPLDA